MIQFKEKYFNTKTGEISDSIFNVIKTTIYDYMYFGIIGRWKLI